MKLAIATLVLFSLSTMGCNLYGALDNPGEVRDRYAVGVAMANEGRCNDAVDMFNSITIPSDDVLVALGWAQLCVGGATATNIATSLYKFSSNTTDYTVIGTLGRLLLPMTGAKRNAISQAIETFGKVTDTTRRSLQTGIAHFALTAAILADQAPLDGDVTLVRTDISAATCSNSAANCAIGCAAGMPNSEVTSFTNAINAAVTSLSLTGAGDLKALASAVQTGLGATVAAARCFIFNQTIPSP